MKGCVYANHCTVTPTLVSVILSGICTIQYRVVTEHSITYVVIDVISWYQKIVMPSRQAFGALLRPAN